MRAEKTILDLLASQAEQRGEAVALRSADTVTITYRDLLQRVQSMRRRLRAMGVQRGDRVAIVLPNGLDAAIAFPGVASTATAAPLNPLYRPSEFEFYLDDLRPKAIVVADREHPVVAVAKARNISIVSDTIEAQPASSGDIDFPQPDDVALILHTSGTTSRPKIVPLSQANLCASAQNISQWLKLTPNDCCLNVMPLFHIHGLIAALLSSLRAGASVICAPGFVSTEFFGWLLAHRPTWYSAVPTMHQAILARPETADFDHSRSRLRFIRSSSAPMPPVVAQALEERFGVPVIEAYGMTEASHQMCSNPLPPAARKFGSVGLAAGPEVAIMDADGQLLPRETSGEVVIRGANVTRGYEANPQANRESFTNGWFRTGDVGYLDRDGYLHLSGRIKEIINRGGEKISPREVDELLLQHPAVAEALTFALPDPRVGEEIAAVVVLRSDANASEADLIQFAAQKLAEFKVPRRILIRDEIPKGPTGKPQRIGLAERLGLNGDEQNIQRAHVEPTTDMEKIIAGIWRSVLKLDSISTNARFFDIGGDSILAAQVVARVHQQIGCDVPIVLLFQSPTIAEMARAIDANPIAGESPSSPANDNGVVPASFAQRRLWFLDQLHPRSIAYNNAHAIHLSGDLDTVAVRDAVQQIVKRHDALRSRFMYHDGVPFIQVNEPVSIELPIDDVSNLPAGVRESEVRRLSVKWSSEPFDLSTGPVARFRLLKLDDREHVLVYAVHHIASDRWSVGIFVRELLHVLRGDSNGLPAPARYLDYAAGQHCGGAAFESHINFWRDELSPLPAPFELNADHPRPPVQSSRGDVHRVRLPSHLVQSLAVLAQSRGATMFTVMLTAFEVFLFRYTAQEDAVLGTTVAERNRLELEAVIGLFVNVLPVRCRIRAGMSFEEILDRTRSAMLGVIAHQDLPLDALVDALHAPRDPSRSPLFQVMFNYHNVPLPPKNIGAIEARVEDVDLGASRFDLTLTITPGPDEFTAAFEYCRDLFEPKTIERMSENFLTLLESIVATPHRPVDELPILSPRQREEILIEWNRDAVDAPPDRCVHEMFEDQAHRTPDATALVVGTERLSYAELNRRVNQFAHHLRATGVGPESLVGICLTRTSHLIVAILGVLKSGGAYLPLDPEYPRQRLAFMLEDSNAAVLVTEESLLGSLSFTPAKVICIERDAEAILRESVEDPQRVSQPNHLAYVIYTSGSTGRPKGVAIEHRAPAALARWAMTGFSNREMSAVLGVASVCFDLSVFEIFLSLTRGASLIFAASALQLGDFPAADEATFAFLVPSVFAEMLYANMVPRNLIGIALGGEAVPEVLARRAQELPGVEAVYNLYGPTEDTVISVGHRIQRNETGPPPIGKSIGGGRAYILDAHRQPVPMGVAGELYLGGIKVARGYLERPELTAERFVADPCGPPASRLYRTGDLCRFRHDGNIQFISRIDHQIKIRGFRVELGEVESVLSQHPSVRQCCATTDGEGADRRLIAFLTANDPPPTVHDLRRHIAALVPSHMVPSSFVFLDAMPLNPSGKVDRAALANLQSPRAVEPRKAIEPFTQLQEQLASIWCSALGIDRVGLHDNFFEIGGHSLRAVSVIARLQESLSISVPLRAMFEHPAIHDLAAFIESRPISRLTISPREQIKADLELSPAQRTTWFEHHRAGESGIYNVTVARRLFGPLDPSRLEFALNRVIDRHEMLRTYFPMVDGSPRVEFAPPDRLRVSVPVIDCRAIAPAAREAELARILRVECETPFDLERLPLIRAKIVQIDDKQFVFSLSIHHIAIDDWSIRILFDEISRFYDGTGSLPPVSGRYPDFTAWLRRWMEGDEAQKQFEYWKSQLAGAPTLLALPTDRPRPVIQTFHGARERVQLAPRVVEKLHELAKAERATAFMALLTAFNILLMEWTGEVDLVIASPSANRQRSDVQCQIGYFLNMMALRLKLTQPTTFREALREVRRVTLDAWEHQDLPFETLVERLRPTRTATHTPWANVMFVHLAEGPPQLRLPGIRSEVMSAFGGGAKCDLGILLDAVDGGVEGWLEYNTDLFYAATIQKLARRFESLLESVVTNPDRELDPFGASLPPSRSTVAADQAILDQSINRARTETHEKLIRIWRDVLHIQAIQIDDDFFELGGNSFLVVRALSQIQKQFRQKLPVGMFFAAPTIAKLAAILDAAGNTLRGGIDSEHVMPLQSKGDGLPLFLAPGAEGHALIFRELAERLGEERPIYALQFTEIAPSPGVVPNLHDIAARTIEHMQRVQPGGPYLLAGYSFGGTLAYEMAQQLVAAGHQVDLVALFDSFPPGVVRTKSPLRRLPVHLGHLLRDGPGGARRHLGLVAQRIRQRISALINGPAPIAPHSADALRALCTDAYQSYRPPKYPGDIVLFCAIERDGWMDFSVVDYLNGWSELVGGEITVYNVSATHSTILDPANLDELANQIKQCLQRRATR